MKHAALLTLFVLLSGCNSLNLSSLKPDLTPIDRSYFTLDTKQRILCQGNSNDCVSIDTITSAASAQLMIEGAFQEEIPGPNLPVNTMKLLLHPKNGSHKITAVTGVRYRYKIPATDAMGTTWQALKQAHNSHYHDVK